ncbi:hypothetical protein Aperf_G00000078545 [Anoplocephala perfoliata]
MIGQSVTLRCTVSSRFAARTNLSVIFLQNNTMQSENCNAYHNDKYEVICEPNEQRSNGPTRTYLFHIKSVSWTDRGKWTCLLSGSSSDIFLDVHVPPKMAPIQVTKIALPNIRPLSPSRGSDVLSDINSGVDLNSHSPQIFGLGTRTNPYDLRSGAELHLTCQTECGYPQALPEWTVNNMFTVAQFTATIAQLVPSKRGTSDLEPRKIESSRNVVTETCDPRPQTRNMAKSTIALKVQCDSYHLSGINKLRCAITGTNDPAASKHIYILCRGK